MSCFLLILEWSSEPGLRILNSFLSQNKQITSIKPGNFQPTRWFCDHSLFCFCTLPYQFIMTIIFWVYIQMIALSWHPWKVFVSLVSSVICKAVPFPHLCLPGFSAYFLKVYFQLKCVCVCLCMSLSVYISVYVCSRRSSELCTRRSGRVPPSG